MATLEKIRNRAGLLIIVVGLALFAFIIGDFLNSGSTYFRQTHEKVAEVNGEVIRIQDYQERIDEMVDVYKIQMGTNNLSEEYMPQIRQSVFDGMVQDIILGEEMSKLGMTVSPEELFDMVQGENISPMIQQMQMFINPETGMFDKNALLQFLKTINDENLSMYSIDQQVQLLQARNFWLFWEKNIKRQRMEQKYTTLLSKAIAANVLDAKEAFNETAESSDIIYAMQSYNTIPDSTVQVSKSEIEKLYNQRKELYKQQEAKVIKYISVDIVPSPEDYAKVSADIEALKDEFAAATDVADLVNENSEVPYMDVYLSEEAFEAEMRQFATTAEVGDIYGPVYENNIYKMYKLIDKVVAPDSVKVSHIMLVNTGSANDQVLLDSLKNVLKSGGNFAELAREYSVDQASAENGGELGWFTEIGALRGLGEEFKDAMFNGPLNEVVEVKSLYGTHLVKVTEKTKNVPKYKVADIEMTVSPSSKTYSNLYNDLNQYISNHGNVATLDETAREAGYNVISDYTVNASDQMIGTIRNSRPVIRWAFENKKGKISEIFECDDKFVVTAVQGTIPEGYRSLSSVESALRSELITRKKGEIITRELAGKNLNSVDAYAQAMGANVDSVKFVSFGTRRITNIGVEPKLNAIISLTPVNQVSAPVAGNNGVYVFQVTEKHEDAKEYNEAEQIRSIDATNTYRFGFQAIQSLTNQADITDNRIHFY